MNDKSVSSPATGRFDQLVEEYLNLLQHHKAPSVEAWVKDYPEHAEQLLELLPFMAKLENVTPGQSSSAGHIEAIRGFQVPRQIGQYSIIREIGRGGMGVVYEARHTTMKRFVALKVLPTMAREKNADVERFMRESRAAGRLHHTNIVPVFEVGKTDEGLHFYAMQLIHGENLSQIIDEIRRIEQATEAVAAHQGTRASGIPAHGGDPTITHSLFYGPETTSRPTVPIPVPHSQGDSAPTTAAEQGTIRAHMSDTHRLSSVGHQRESYFHRVGRVGLQVADALQYAHANGILHRDIKPSNLILDTEGNVWVTDFGLAKEHFDDFTASGEVIGTLRYMAPERFSGQADHRSDVYSLGLTLYELATLRYAFDEEDRARLIHALLREAPIPPRILQPNIPRDLETIILKSINRQPEKRYSNAGELAEDLRRFVEHRPIHARRTSPAEHFWRWCRRNPAMAVALAALLLLGAVLVAGSIQYGWSRQQHANQLKIENTQTRSAWRRSLEHLFQANLDRATALRHTQEPGRNLASVESLAGAAALLRQIESDPERIELQKFKLRNQAITAMTLMDMQERRSWNVQNPQTPNRETGIVAVDYPRERFAQADESGNIHICQVDSRELLATLPTQGKQAWQIQFSSHGKYLVATFMDVSNPRIKDIRVWDTSDYSVKLELIGNRGTAGVQFTPSGDRIAVDQGNKTVEFFDISTGQAIHELTLPRSLWQFRFAGDDSHVVVAYRKSAQLQFWDIDGSGPLFELEAGEQVDALDFAHDAGVLAAACKDLKTYVWKFDESDIDQFSDSSLRSCEPLVLSGNRAPPKKLAVAPHGEVLILSAWDDTTRMFDLVSGQEVVRVEGLRLTDDGFNNLGNRIAFSSQYLQSGIWEVPEIPMLRRVNTGAVASLGYRVLFHPAQTHLVVLGTNDGIEIWDWQRNRRDARFEIGDTRDIRFTSDGKTLYTSGQDGLRKWDVTSKPDPDAASIGRTTRWNIENPESMLDRPTNFFHFNEQHSLLSVLEQSGAVTVVNANDLTTVDIPADGYVVVVQTDPQGKYVMTSNHHARGIQIWDAGTGRHVQEIVSQWNSPTFGFHPGGSQMVVNSVFQRWQLNLDRWEAVQKSTKDRPDSFVGAIQYSPDGKWIAENFTRYIPQLVDAETGSAIARLEPPKGGVMVANLQFDRTGQYLLLKDQETVYV